MLLLFLRQLLQPNREVEGINFGDGQAELQRSEPQGTNLNQWAALDWSLEEGYYVR